MIAAIQLRVSQLADTSIESQRMRALSVCKAQGWTYGPEFKETISASEFGEARRLAKAKPQERDEFNRLLTELATGAYNVLVVTEVSRSTRDIEYLGKLAKACTRNGVKLCVGDRLMDLSESADFTLVAIEGVLAQGESKRLSKRSLRGHESARAEGRPPTSVAPFGYLRPPREAKAPVYQIPHPINAGLVRWAVVDAIPYGWTLGQIARVWEAAPGAKRLPTRATVRKAILNPSIIGMRPQINGEPLAGNWQALVDLDDYARCAAVLQDPKRRSNVSQTSTTLLSGIAQCSVCDSKIRVEHAPEGDRYRCPRGHCMRVIPDVDSLAIDALKTELLRLSLIAVNDQTPGIDHSATRRVTLLANFESAKTQLENFRKTWVKMGFSPTDAAAAIQQYKIDVDEAQRAIPEDRPSLPGDSLFDQAVAAVRTSDDAPVELMLTAWINTRWGKMTLLERRGLVRSHLEIRVTGMKNTAFDPLTNGVSCSSQDKA